MARQSPNAAKSLSQLQKSTPDNGAAPPAVRRARQVPLQDLSAEQLLTLLHAGEGVAYLLPYALEKVEEDPWMAVEFHPGDLLLAVLGTRANQWAKGSLALSRLRKLAETSLKDAAKRPKSTRHLEVEAEVKSWLARQR